MNTPYTRRNFIICSGGVIGAGLLPGTILPSPAGAKENTGTIDLAVVQGDTARAAARAIELFGGMERFVRPNDTVLLKPNVSFPNPPRMGSTTSPELVKAVAELALKAGAVRVIVADNTMRGSAACFEATGIQAAFAGSEKAKIISLDRESSFTEIEVPHGKALKKVMIARLIGRCNVVINLPCAKSHSATEVSFGLKNLMGLIWDRQFFHTGADLHWGIAELATVMRPHLTILDASRALITAGPTGPGKVQELRTVIAGTDPLAVDAYAVSLAAWNNRSLDARSVLHLSHAYTLGVGKIDVTKMAVVKESV
ncbi:MAG: DUF362 domain-containing protein [Candidatus Latescibacter sp.]|nr:DUF362 domain-containing protein [Candidatus Latescibacter sp.]